MSDKCLSYQYQFKLADNQIIGLSLQIDAATSTLISPEHQSLPSWTELEFHQCPNCPLSGAEHTHCPAAKNLIPLLELSGSLVSYDQVTLKVITPERSIIAKTTIQRAVSSLLGLMMATSPCPHTEYLKPMARFHLPLATEEETIYRTTSMYLLAQYFRSKEGLDYALNFEGLAAIYQNLKTINRALANRFRAAIKEDASVNAIILLDLLSQAVTWSIEDNLEELKYLFKSYGSGINN
jgi:hypothetical protein